MVVGRRSFPIGWNGNCSRLNFRGMVIGKSSETAQQKTGGVYVKSPPPPDLSNFVRPAAPLVFWSFGLLRLGFCQQALELFLTPGHRKSSSKWGKNRRTTRSTSSTTLSNPTDFWKGCKCLVYWSLTIISYPPLTALTYTPPRTKAFLRATIGFP